MHSSRIEWPSCGWGSGGLCPRGWGICFWVGGGGACPPGRCLPEGCLPRECLPKHLPMNIITDRCKNFTFPQLLLQMVITIQCSGRSRISLKWGRQPFGGEGKGWHQHTILPNFSKNCMKLKEFGGRLDVPM